jgi:hypothetical protein
MRKREEDPKEGLAKGSVFSFHEFIAIEARELVFTERNIEE